jgi:hypothetical protein
MLIINVYDETSEQAQAVAETLKSAFRKVPEFIFVSSAVATPETRLVTG